MSARRYYSMRTGKNPNAQRLDLPTLCRLFKDLYVQFEQQDFFQEAFGYFCVDEGEVPGTVGFDIEAHILLNLRKTNLWPIKEKCLGYSEDDLFDVIEYLYDHISKPLDGYYHNYSNCGWHYTAFDPKSGQMLYRDKINQLLQDYGDGFELSEDGEILTTDGDGLGLIFKADLSTADPENIDIRVRSAVRKFRQRHASPDDRRDAIRDLADVLEFLRPRLQQVLTKRDESDLFQIANNFGIRHHNDKQQTDYDKAIWYSWMFYYYLATVHAVIRLLRRQQSSIV